MGGSSPSLDTLPVGRGTGGPLPRDNPGGRRRKDRGDWIGRGNWGGFLKGSYNLGISPLSKRQVMPGPENFCFLTVQPRNEEVNDICSLLGREDWKT